jgi:hypothetical protein
MTCDPWLSLRWWEWFLAGCVPGFVLGAAFTFWLMHKLIHRVAANIVKKGQP